MPFFSIVIPVYDAEAYLRRCTDSIRKQSFTDYEVLLVDDASEDSSAEISEDICRSDHRFRYYLKKHEGAAAARNFGISHSKGEYIVFVDSDDFVEELLLEKLAATILEEERPEVCFMNSHYVVENSQKRKNEIFQLPDDGENVRTYTAPEFLKLVTRPGSHIPGSTWLMVLQRKFLQRCDLKFNEELIWSEDSDLAYHAFVCADKIKYCSYCGYNYYIANKSSVSKELSLEKAKSRLYVYSKWSRYFLNDKGVQEKYSREACERVVQQFLTEYCSVLNNWTQIKDKKQRRQLYELIREDRDLWKKCQNYEYRNYVLWGIWGGTWIKKGKETVKKILKRR